MTRHRVLISAHRCGAGNDRSGENGREALEATLRLDVDFVEFDVQRLADGSFVVIHDREVEIDGERRPVKRLTPEEFEAHSDGGLGYQELLGKLAAAGKKAHLDVKFAPDRHPDGTPSYAPHLAVAHLAVEALGAADVVVTTGNDLAARALRDWAEEHGHELLVGLSLGRNVAGRPWRERVGIRRSELFPGLRYVESRANVVVANYALAWLGVGAFARRRGLPLLVWTVDAPWALRWWLRPGRAWLVTTNHPALALEIRDRGTARLRP
ncbi:glycerophosphodiester phosphodiesterase family protein [Nocardioides sp.]|uniref:glycerophosphodiester phosphodiesterase n=1 Tax=Nocardioides sp. TaxID=35761 RepID=UPI0031FF04DC|nr:cytoplasmic glycerophosphodiester phosphodiesterase [Nocardioides sp.]